MAEPQLRVRLLTGRYRGLTLPRDKSVAEYLVATGQAEWPTSSASAPETADQPAPETPESRTLDAWPLQTSPEEYLERYPDGPNADLARSLVGE